MVMTTSNFYRQIAPDVVCFTRWLDEVLADIDVRIKQAEAYAPEDRAKVQKVLNETRDRILYIIAEGQAAKLNPALKGN